MRSWQNYCFTPMLLGSPNGSPCFRPHAPAEQAHSSGDSQAPCRETKPIRGWPGLTVDVLAKRSQSGRVTVRLPCRETKPIRGRPGPATDVFAKRSQSASDGQAPRHETKPIRGGPDWRLTCFCETRPIRAIPRFRAFNCQRTLAAATMIATRGLIPSAARTFQYPIPLLSCGQAELDGVCLQPEARSGDLVV